MVCCYGYRVIYILQLDLQKSVVFLLNFAYTVSSADMYAGELCLHSK